MESSDKKYTIFAGVNGAGKSTLYYLHPELQNEARVNMDEIARGLGDWKDMSVALEAGRRAIKLRNDFFEKGISFNQETTLCGHDPINTIIKARKLGYYIEMHYVGVDSPEICKERVRKRVAEGGHGVDEEVIERRYVTSLINLKKAIPLCNKILFYDNTSMIELFCIYNDGCYKFLRRLPKWFKENVLSGS